MLNAILFDIDGVLYTGDTAVPGAAEAVRWVRERSIPHLFVTNTTTKPSAAIVDKLRRMDVAVEEHELLTPPVAASAWLTEQGREPVALFIPPPARVDFGSLSTVPDDAESGARAVVIGDLAEGFTFPTVNRAFRLLAADPDCALVALGMTRYLRASDGGLRLDAGPYVKALEYAIGRSAVVLGKPDPAFFEAALRRLDARAEEAMMIGDDVIGDVAGAQRAGLAGVLVQTGKFRPQDLSRGVQPDAILASIAELPELLDGRFH